MRSMGRLASIIRILSWDSSHRQCLPWGCIWKIQLNTDKRDWERRNNCSFLRPRLASYRDWQWHIQLWKLSKSSWIDTKTRM
jgi:hypothetical protein